LRLPPIESNPNTGFGSDYWGQVTLAVSAGDPEKGLPHVQNFSESMFDTAMSEFRCIEKKVYDDLGYTGRSDYKVWFGYFSN